MLRHAPGDKAGIEFVLLGERRIVALCPRLTLSDRQFRL